MDLNIIRKNKIKLKMSKQRNNEKFINKNKQDQMDEEK